MWARQGTHVAGAQESVAAIVVRDGRGCLTQGMTEGVEKAAAQTPLGHLPHFIGPPSSKGMHPRRCGVRKGDGGADLCPVSCPSCEKQEAG